MGRGSRSRVKTADIEGDAGGIEKGVLMAAIDGRGLPLVSNFGVADGAEDAPVCLIFRKIVRTVSRRPGRLASGGKRRDAAPARVNRPGVLCRGNGPQSRAPCR